MIMASNPSLTELPTAIATYMDAHDRHEVATALAQFTDDAIVMDDGHTYTGRVGVETFLTKAASEFTFTRELIGAEQSAPNEWLVTNHIVGNFPGGVVDLRYHYRLDGGLIARLEIAP